MCFCCNSLRELWLTDNSAQKSGCFCMKEILFLKLVSPGWLGAERRTDSGKLRLHEPNGPTSGPGHGGLSFPPEWWAFQAGLAASISRVCRPPFHRFLSPSQMTRSSSWGSSLSPPPLSSPTSWSPRTRAAQPTSRPSSEGGRAPERCTLGVGGRMHNRGGGGREGATFWRSLSRWLDSAGGQIFRNRSDHGFSFTQIHRVGTQRFSFSWNQWRHAWKVKRFTRDPSEIPDGLVMTLSVTDGVGQRPNFKNRTSCWVKSSLYLGVRLFLSSPFLMLLLPA